jgi:hypothetical protein
MSGMSGDQETTRTRRARRGDDVLYPDRYAWYVFVSALDVILTTVLLHFGAEEVNLVANWVLGRYNIAGLVVFKFVLVSLVLSICEYVGHRRPKLGQWLIEWAVGLTCIPVLLAILQLLFDLPKP